MKDLYTETMELLAESEETISSMAKGSEVNFHWLAKLRQGKFENPGIKTMQKLHDYLVSQKTQAA